MDERRIVSVLFCDVVGSTSLAAQLDPEEWAEIIRAAFPHLIEPVERYGGTVARLMGDAILAFFGAPVAHEDDAQRAILAGLGILDEIHPLRGEIQQEYGLDLNVRVGINTGIVVVGDFGTERTFEYTAMGDAVNIAARMEQTAAPGTIQVTAETYALTYSHFMFEPLGPVSVKGKDEPVDAYRITGRADGQRRRTGELGAPLIGRERELETFWRKLTKLRDGQGGIIALAGNAGLGKSRLLEELRGHGELIADCVPTTGWIEDRLVSYEVSAPYGLVRRRICEGLALPDGAMPDIVRARVTDALGGLPVGDRERAVRTVNLLFSGTPDRQPGGQASDNPTDMAIPFGGDEFRQELVELVELVWRRWIEECGAGVYVVDDFHHADMASVEILEPLLDAVRDLPLLVVLAFRPERRGAVWGFHQRMLERHPKRYTNIALMPLDNDQTASLIDALLTGASLPEDFRSALLDRVDGNPLFAEEIVRSLIGQGLVVARPEAGGMRLRLAPGANLSQSKIPTTLQALMQERMDRLPGVVKQTLQIAAVIGRTFSHEQLAAVVDAPEQLGEQLTTLQEALLIRDAPNAGVHEYSFYHALTQEAAYQLILYRQRRRLHRRVGEAFEQLYAESLNEHAAMLAYHFASALDERAVSYATLAGRRALELYAHTEAIDQFERAIDVARRLQLQPPIDALQGRGTAYLRQGAYEQAREDITEALQAAKQVNDSQREWELLILMGESWDGNDYARAGEWYIAAQDHAEAIGNELLIARALLRLGNWYANTERVIEARTAVELALDIFERRHDQRGIAETIDQLATVADLSADADRMLTYFRQAAALFEELGDQLRLSSALANIGQSWGWSVFFPAVVAANISVEESLAAAERALEIAKTTGWRAGRAYAELSIGTTQRLRGQLDLAEFHTDCGLAIAEEVKHNEWLALGYSAQGLHLASLLEPDAAAQVFERALHFARLAGSGHFINLALAYLAQELIAGGELERATGALEQAPGDLTHHTTGARMVWHSRAALALARGDPHTALRIITTLFDTALNFTELSDIPDLAWDLGNVLHVLGRRDEAREAFEAAIRGMRARGSRLHLWRAHSALARLHGSVGDLDGAEREFAAALVAVRELAESIGDELRRAAFLARAEQEIARSEAPTGARTPIREATS